MLHVVKVKVEIATKVCLFFFPLFYGSTNCNDHLRNYGHNIFNGRDQGTVQAGQGNNIPLMLAIFPTN